LFLVRYFVSNLALANTAYSLRDMLQILSQQGIDIGFDGLVDV
jgi:hypothetical protein